MKTKLMILIILFFLPTAAIAEFAAFTSAEKEISALCGKTGGFFGAPGPPAMRNGMGRMAHVSGIINQTYPGSTINCSIGSGVFAVGTSKYYFNNWKVVRMTQISWNSLDYEVSDGGKYWKISDGKNYLKLRLDKEQFIDANLPVLAETAEMAGKKKFVNFRNNELMDLLNKFYSSNKQNYTYRDKNNQSFTGDITDFTAMLLLSPSLRVDFLTWSEQYLVNLTPEKIPATSTPKNNDISKVDLKKFEALILGCWDKEKKGDYDAAILDGKQAIEMYDQNPHVHLCVGGSFIQKGDISGKKEFYEQAINYLQKGLAALENFTEKDAPAGEKEFFTERVDYAKSKFQELTAAEKKLTDAKEKEKSSTKKKAKGKK